jgi:hypothetical protein
MAEIYRNQLMEELYQEYNEDTKNNWIGMPRETLIKGGHYPPKEGSALEWLIDIWDEYNVKYHGRVRETENDV